MTSILLAPPFSETIEVTDLTCRTKNAAGSIVEEVTVTSLAPNTANTEIFVDLGEDPNELAISVSSSTTGATSTTLTLTYEITQAWTATTWLYFEIPKSNLLYETNDPADPLTLVTQAIAEDMTVTLDSTTLSVDTGTLLYTAGTDYDPDQLAVTFTGSVAAAVGSIVTVEIEITNPPVTQDLIGDWVLIIKSDNEEAITAFTDLYDVEQATLPTTGLITDTARTDSVDNSVAVDGTVDGIGVSGATYTFTMTNYNPMPADAVLIITRPTAIGVADIDAMTFSCTQNCASSPTFSLESTYKIRLDGFQDDYFDSSQIMIFEIFGWTNPTDSATYELTATSYFEDSSGDLQAIETFSGFEINAQEGLCYISDVYVTDEDTRIYA